eukprot:2090901-Rhodomonas_salina.4
MSSDVNPLARDPAMTDASAACPRDGAGTIGSSVWAQSITLSACERERARDKSGQHDSEWTQSERERASVRVIAMTLGISLPFSVPDIATGIALEPGRADSGIDLDCVLEPAHHSHTPTRNPEHPTVRVVNTAPARLQSQPSLRL